MWQQVISSKAAVLAVALHLFCFPISAISDSEKQIEVEIPVHPQLAEYIHLLAAPPYMLVALENARASPLGDRRITILDKSSFRMGTALVRFTGGAGSLYQYQGRVEWDLAVTKAALTVLVDLDTARVAQGQVLVRVRFPLAGSLPDGVNERLRAKLMLAADAGRQAQLLAYLQKVKERINDAPSPKPSMYELILADAYNASLPLQDKRMEPGEAEPLSDQLLLIATLSIWLVAILAALLLRRRWIKRIGAGPA
jgi:hypothetical protein